MMRRGSLLLAAACVWALAAEPPSCSPVPGWRQEGAARTFAPDSLFEYMNGNAEGYLIYGFVRMHGVTCKRGEDQLLIDISEMADPDSAYGIFTANKDPQAPEKKIGMAAQIVPRRAVFVKDKYYVEIAANPEKDHTAALEAFVAAMEPKIAGRTALPDALGWFPQEKLKSVRLVPESILGFRLLKRGYLAEYEAGRMYLIREASPEAAAGIMEKLRARVADTAPAQVADESFQKTDKYLGRLLFFRKGAWLGGVANVPEGQDPARLAGGLAAKLP